MKLFKIFHSAESVILLLMTSNIINSIAGIVGGVLTARWILPEELGSFNTLGIVSSYVILIQMGIPSGLSREFPLFMGQGRKEYAKDLAATAQWFSLALGVPLLIIALIISAYYWMAAQPKLMAGAIVIGVSIFQTLFCTKYLKILYRSSSHFNRLSIITLVQSFALLISLPLVYYYDYYGLCMRGVLLSLLDIGLTFWLSPLLVKPSWNPKHWLELFKKGAPIYAVAEIYGMWPVVQRTMILATLGIKSLGLFSLAFIVYSTLNTYTSSIASVTFPQMASAQGSGHSVKKLLSIPLKFVIQALIVSVVVVFIGWFVLPYLVNLFLPNYTEGIEAAQWMLPVALLGPLTVFSNVYMIIQKNHHRLISFLIGVGCWFLFLFSMQNFTTLSLKLFSQAFFVGLLAILIVDALFYFGYIRKEKIGTLS